MKNSNSRRAIRVATVAHLLLFLGCGPSSDDVIGEVGSRTSELNGTPISYTFEGDACTNRQAEFKAKFDQAFSQILVPTVLTNPGPLVACLADSILSGEIRFPAGSHDNVRYPEYIALQLRENVTTNIKCSDNQALWCGSGGGETFTCNPAAMDRSVIDVAGIAIHEIAHKAYDHALPPEDYQLSVNEQAWACVASLAQGLGIPNGTRRSGLTSSEVTLAQVGTESDSPATPTYCGTGQALSGFRGTHTSGQGIISLRGVCKTLSSLATNLLAPSGGAGTTAFQDECPSSEIAVGAAGTADLGLRSIGSICALKSVVEAGGLTSSAHAPVGAAVGPAWQRRCPPFHALKGLRLRASSSSFQLIDRLEMVCQDVRDGRSMGQTALTRAGSTGQYRYLESCQSRGFMKGMISAANTYATPEISVTRLGGWCTNVRDVPTALSFDPINRVGYVMPTHGGSDVNIALDQCPSGQALVGLVAHVASGTVTGIQGKCADVNAWSNGTTAAQSDLPFHGRSTTASQRMCASRSFLVGWFLDTDNVIHGVTPVCRQFGSNGVANATEAFDGSLASLLGPLLL